jgi:hypothetical protein
MIVLGTSSTSGVVLPPLQGESWGEDGVRERITGVAPISRLTSPLQEEEFFFDAARIASSIDGVVSVVKR